MSFNNHRPWSDADDKMIFFALDEGLGYRKIARVLGRSVAATTMRAGVLRRARRGLAVQAAE